MIHATKKSEITFKEILKVKIMKRGVIKECDRKMGDFISAVNTRKKKVKSMWTVLKQLWNPFQLFSKSFN